MRFTITDIYAESSFAVPFQLPIPIDITQDRYVLYFKIDFIKINEQ
jgi:hypothetical protein